MKKKKTRKKKAKRKIISPKKKTLFINKASVNDQVSQNIEGMTILCWYFQFPCSILSVSFQELSLLFLELFCMYYFAVSVAFNKVRGTVISCYFFC